MCVFSTHRAFGALGRCEFQAFVEFPECLTFLLLLSVSVTGYLSTLSRWQLDSFTAKVSSQYEMAKLFNRKQNQFRLYSFAQVDEQMSCDRKSCESVLNLRKLV